MGSRIPLAPPPPPLPAGFDTAATSGKSKKSGTKYDLCIAETSALVDAIKANNSPLVGDLLQKGYSVNQVTILGTPLSIAVRANNLELVKLLVSQAKCDINAGDCDGETAFCLSIRKWCDPEISLYLLANGAAMDCLDPVTKLSLLATAVDKKHTQIVEAMISRGCDVNIRDSNNSTPLAHACLLPEPGADDDVACDSWAAGLNVKRHLIVTLYNAGADVNARLGPPFTGRLIHKLVLERCYHALSVLLEVSLSSDSHKLDINKQNIIEKNTPLHIAVACGDERIVKLLVLHGCEINISNTFCDSPLSKAIKDKLYDQTSVIKLLIEHGADPNFEDKTDKSRRKGPCNPLFAAIENADRSTVDLLLAHGADLSVFDYRGQCVIMACLDNGMSIGLLHYIVDSMDERNIKYDISSWDFLIASFQWTKHLQYLIDRGLDVNATNIDGAKIIHFRHIKHHPSSLEIALQNGLDPDALTADGNTALSAYVGCPSYWEVVRLLIRYGADINRVYVTDEVEHKLSPVEEAFHVEYDADDYRTTQEFSFFKYLLNCGATATVNQRAMRGPPDSLEEREHSDSSDSDSGEDEAVMLYKKNLLSDFQGDFSEELLLNTAVSLDEARMPHKCIQCIQTFPTSGEMVMHMKENHSSFVEDTQMKIDRSKESSFEAKKQLAGNNATAARCPFCTRDCQNRRKLMLHLELEHRDDDAEAEPQLKIIRLENDSKDKLFNGLNAEKSSEAELQAKKVSIVNNFLNSLGSIEGKSEVALPGTTETIEVSATSIRLPEKRYKCFWCDASFRKRGKLMDHIDMFHKANKEQIEEEAELLQTTGINMPPAKVTAPRKSLSTTTIQEKKSLLPTKSKMATKNQSKKKHTATKQFPEFPPANIVCLETPNNNVCAFTVLASITEISRTKINPSHSNGLDKPCIFFNRKKNNPLPPVIPGLAVEPMPLMQEFSVPESIDTTPMPLTQEYSVPESVDTTPFLMDQTSTSPLPPPYTDTSCANNSMMISAPNLATKATSELQDGPYMHLARPQPIHPMFDPQFHSYQQQVMFQTSPQIYLNQQQQQQHLHQEHQRRELQKQQVQKQREQQLREQQEQRLLQEQRRKQQLQQEQQRQEKQRREQQLREQQQQEQLLQEQQQKQQLLQEQQQKQQLLQEQREQEQQRKQQLLQEQQREQQLREHMRIAAMQYQHQRDIAHSLRSYNKYSYFLPRVTQRPDSPLDLRLPKF